MSQFSEMINMRFTQLAYCIPDSIKSRLPAGLKRCLKNKLLGGESALFPCTSIPPPLPPGQSLDSMRQLLEQVQLEGVDPGVMRGYLDASFLRFLHTLELIPAQTGALLELGANPYFMTTLLERFRQYGLILANYYGTEPESVARQYQLAADGGRIERRYYNFNVEQDRFPFDDDAFDAVLFCEILEHLTADPLRAMLEIKRVLRPGGLLILTTPNVARLENVARMLAGENIYDPYSGYGPYGRHNREYTLDELRRWLGELGFRIDRAYTSDVHPHATNHLINSMKVWKSCKRRRESLGQYSFIRAINQSEPDASRPAWLFRAFNQ
ncbi:class I SAM-dependent methyltransferase [Candidatus Sumerlaeota bacterium]|nr:class I SAM-dependent methyltransferase [Candidatus Sumerlaeota bacterium]